MPAVSACRSRTSWGPAEHQCRPTPAGITHQTNWTVKRGPRCKYAHTWHVGVRLETVIGAQKAGHTCRKGLKPLPGGRVVGLYCKQASHALTLIVRRFLVP